MKVKIYAHRIICLLIMTCVLCSSILGQQPNMEVEGKIKADSIQVPTNAQKDYILKSDPNGNGEWSPLFNTQPALEEVDNFSVADPVKRLRVVDGYVHILYENPAQFDIYKYSQGMIDTLSSIPVSAPTDFDLDNGFAYILDNFTDSIYVLDVSDPNSVTFRDRAATGTSGLRVAASGGIAVVHDGDDTGLRVYNVNDPDSIYLLTNTEFLLFDVRDWLFDGEYLYILEGVFSDIELRIIDLTNPSSPIEIFNTLLGDIPDRMDKNGEILFVMDGGNDQVISIDVSNPGVPANLDTIGSTGGFQSIAVDDRFMFIGGNLDGLLFSVDIREPLNMDFSSLTESYLNVTHIDLGGNYCYGIDEASNELFVIALKPQIPALDPEGSIIPFSGTYNGRFEIQSSLSEGNSRDHLRLRHKADNIFDLWVDDGFDLKLTSQIGPVGVLNEHMRINHNTNFITFNSPSFMLDEGSFFIKNLGGSNNKGFLLGIDNQADFGWILQDNGGSDQRLHLRHFGATITEDNLVSILANGKVGINTSNPAEELSIRDTDQDDHTQIRMGSSTNNINFDIDVVGFPDPRARVGTFTGNKMELITNNIPRLTILPDGRIGINESTPDRELTIFDYDSNGAAFLNIRAESNDRELLLGVNQSIGGIIGTQTNSALDIRTNSLSRMKIDASGRIGIGDDPNGAYDLTLADTDNDGNMNIIMTNSIVDLEFGMNSTSALIGTESDHRFTIQTNNIGRLTIDASGDIGIGTFSPDTKMELSGSGSRYLRLTSTNNSEIGLDLVRAGTGNTDFRIANNTGVLQIQQSLDINGTAPEALFGFTTTAFRPQNTSDNMDLGNGGKRWNDVFITGSVNSSSDFRLKTNIVDLNHGLKAIRALRPVKYNWKDNPERLDLGLIAQDVEEIIPEIVGVPENEEEHYSLEYMELIPVLIKSVQELSDLVDEQSKEIADLEREIQTLKSNHR